MNEKTKEIDVEKIISDIKKDIKEKGYNTKLFEFEDIPIKDSIEESEGFDYDKMISYLDYANHNYSINPYKVIHGNPIFRFVKRFIRKLLKFYIIPIVEEQNTFNAYIVRVNNSFKDYIEENQTEKNSYDTLVEELKVLELKNKNYENQINDLQIKINELAKQKNSL